MRIEGWNWRMAPPQFAFAAIALLGAAVTAPFWHAQRAAGAGDGVTHLRVTSQVILSGVTRLGVNLGEQNFYDSGQMLKNLLYRNPEFAEMTYRSILHCEAGGVGRCVDARPGIPFPGGLLDRRELRGAGRRGGGPARNGDGSGPRRGRICAHSQLRRQGDWRGDWMAIEKDFAGDPGAGWWPTMHGGARFGRAQRSSAGCARAPGIENRCVGRGPVGGSECLFRLHGGDDVCASARPVPAPVSRQSADRIDDRGAHVHVARLAAGLRRYLDTDVHLTPAWAEYSEEFTANETRCPQQQLKPGSTFPAARAAERCGA